MYMCMKKKKFIDTLGPMRGQRGVAASPESLTPGSGAVDCFYRNIHPITKSPDSGLTLLLFLFYFLYLLSKEDESCLHYNRFHLIFFYCFFSIFQSNLPTKKDIFPSSLLQPIILFRHISHPYDSDQSQQVD